MKRCLRLGVARELGRQELEGHDALELRVLGLVDDPHPALAELLENLVVRYRLSNHFSKPIFLSSASQRGSERKVSIMGEGFECMSSRILVHQTLY